MKKVQRLMSMLLLLSVLVIPTLRAFAKEEGMRMTVSGPGIQGEAVINHSDLLMRLEDTGFFGFSGNVAAIKPLMNVGEGYRITAYLGKSNTIMPFVLMEYYPAEEGAGYVHYIGKLDGESLKSVDEWGRLPLSADKAFHKLMDANHIALQTLVLSSFKVETVASAPGTVTPLIQVPPFAIIAIALLLAVLGAVWMHRKRAVSQRSV